MKYWGKVEMFQAIQGWLGYRVGDRGTVQSRRNRGGRGGKSCTRLGDVWRPLKSFLDADGYRCVNLHQDGVQRKFRVARLLLAAFRGPCPDGMEAVHGDGNPSNDRLENLRWDTHEANCRDKLSHGTQQHGSICWNAKLTEESVRTIERLYGDGKTQGEIAKYIGVSRSLVGNVVRGDAWKRARSIN